ncbi:hypothetical protein LTS12_027223 [Elasticomyces elasticus]|nr:hypothetical protein LTS12_027223 [Elasticomyces elasticus]
MPTSETLRSGSDNAAQYNRRVLRKLQKAFERQPDLDLAAALPPRYHSNLASKKADGAHVQEAGHEAGMARISWVPWEWSLSISAARAALEVVREAPNSPHRPLPSIDEMLPARVLCPLSDTVESLLGEKETEWMKDELVLSSAMSQVLRSATLLFQSDTDSDRFVARCSEFVIVKAIAKGDSTEYASLQFLQSERPTFLAPRPHGVVAAGNIWYTFMSYTPGVSLDTIWPKLEDIQKRSLSGDLNNMLLELQEIPFQHGSMLGGVTGQGCKDTRRHRRTAGHPVYTIEGVWEFMYGCARNKDTVYGRFLHNQTFPPREQRIVFIHGDIRPANIVVQPRSDGSHQVTGLIDWEMSGFYPEDLECVKALNNLSPIGKDDWYLYLPECISPKRHFESWHADWVWDSSPPPPLGVEASINHIGDKQNFVLQVNSQAKNTALKDFVAKNGRGTHAQLAAASFDTKAADPEAEARRVVQEIKEQSKSKLG